MLRHYVSLAFRHVMRNKLYALIGITGLAIGFAAAALIGLYVHDELTYERWLPNSDRIYRVSPSTAENGEAAGGPSDIGLWLANDYPGQLAAVTRLFPGGGGYFERGNIERREQILWADANVFDVFRFPVLSGALDGALERPDGLVLTRSAARRYFGDTDPLGETLLYNGREPMVVSAVIEDLPSSTHLAFSVLAPSRASFSPSAEQDASPMTKFGGKLWGAYTYFLLREAEPIAPLRASIRTLFDRHAPRVDAVKASDTWPLVTRPIRSIHLAGPFDPPEEQQLGAVYAAAAIGLLIVSVAAINFVNILTALGVRRAHEVGVRKALGAARLDLFKQYMGESFLYVIAGGACGLALAAAALQPLNAFLRRTIDFAVFADWRVAGASAGLLAIVALAAGAYPSFVLSSFRAATVTKGARTGGAHARVRQALVVVQFAVLIALVIATTVIYRQMALGMREALRQNTEPIVVATLGQQVPYGRTAPCTRALQDRMRRIDGVRQVACSFALPQRDFQMGAPLVRPGARPVPVRYMSLGLGFLELYGYRPVAGRFFSADVGADVSPPDNVWTSPESIVLNETAARQLGFGSAADAVGQTAAFAHLFRQPSTFTPWHEARIIGVVEDFQIGSVRAAIPPAVFFVDEAQAVTLSLKLDGRATPEALDAIDRTWKELGGSGPLARVFFEQTMENMYLDLRRQTQAFTAFAGIAIFIAVLGLVGLAAHAAVSRTKEIGIRKAVGGGRLAIMRLLLWQFSRPVLLANVIAWPVAYYVMASWLQGFARRVELDWWLFAGAGVGALTVAAAAVFAHAWAMAGARPIEALRYQ